MTEDKGVYCPSPSFKHTFTVKKKKSSSKFTDTPNHKFKKEKEKLKVKLTLFQIKVKLGRPQSAKKSFFIFALIRSKAESTLFNSFIPHQPTRAQIQGN